jgi:hypothetical protein
LGAAHAEIEATNHEAQSRSEEPCESASETRRPALSEPRRQHARGDTREAEEDGVVKRGAATKDPHGGLTAKGREYFRRTEGAYLKPGVKKPMREMTPEEMKRKGSWAKRFFGRLRLPPLQDAEGRPTRFALTAAAWGEPVPKTMAAARQIAAKGQRLLVAYGRTKARAKSKTTKR